MRNFSLIDGLTWYWDLDDAPATITDQHRGLVLTRGTMSGGNISKSAIVAPDGGTCVYFYRAYFANAAVAVPFHHRNGFTVNIWVRNTGYSSTGNWIFNHRAAVDGHFQIIAVSASVSTQEFDSAPARSITYTSERLETWHMVTLVSHGYSKLEHYRDGVLVASNDAAIGNRSTTTCPLAIGCGAWSLTGNVLAHVGQLCMAGTWSRPLLKPEVKRLWNQGRGRRYADLKDPWHERTTVSFAGISATGWPHKIHGLANASVAAVHGLAKTSIDAVLGV